MRRYHGTLALLFWLAYSPTAQALDLQEILERARVTPPDRVRFREQRHNPLLKAPMELSGYLEYAAPGQLRKVVESPFQESMLFDGDQVEISRDGQVRRIGLKSRKSILVMLQSIESLLSGDSQSLRRYFDVELTGTLKRWHLKLIPSSGRLSRQLRGLTVNGGDDTINNLRFEMQNGEWQHLEIIHDAAPP
jgi:hypothetical protein